MTRTLRMLLGVIAVVLLSTGGVKGAKLIMKDGTTIEGTVIRNGDSYWVKTADGNTQNIAIDDVQTLVTDDDSSDAATSDAGTSEQSYEFLSSHNRANDAPSALAAVAIWQGFIDKNPDSPDMASAKQELAHWSTLAEQGAEKVNGKWISGDDLKQLIQQAEDLTQEGLQMINQKQTLMAIDKLQQSVRIYPNSYVTNFALGYLKALQKDYDGSIQYYLAATKLKPQAVEAVNNLAVENFEKGRYEQAIDGFQQAAEIQDSEPVARNLYTALSICPEDISDSPKMKPAQEASNILAAKYQISGPQEVFYLMHPPSSLVKSNTGPDAPSDVWSGTGFFISTDGLILTNRHVAKGATDLLVVIGDQQLSARAVAIDDAYDLALIRLTKPRTTPMVSFSPADLPADGADCVVMGFPLMDRLGSEIKITRGIISSASANEGNGADLLTDAKVNPGNSGGPILDKYGNVMAIVCMKSLASATEDSYGIGISAGHIREFLKRNNIDTTLGPTDKVMDTEDIVAQVKTATVCILATK